jgi:hypothetical protein
MSRPLWHAGADLIVYDPIQLDFSLALLDHCMRSDLGDPEKAEVVDSQLLAGKHQGR